MRRLHALFIACSLLAGCGRDTGDAIAPAASTPSHTLAPTVAASVIPTYAAARPAAGDDLAGLSASLAGLSHDEDIDPALLKHPFELPGPITADTEPDGLRRIYGAANVTEGELPGAEGETVHGVILFPEDPKRRAYVYFQDQKMLTGLSMVRITDAGSQWRSAQGIRIGMPLSELVALNGGPFEFLGFDWDYGGQVTDWLGGKLAPVKSGPTLRVQLVHQDLPRGIAYNKLPIGEHTFRSDEAQLAKLKPTIAEISLSFPGHDDE